MNRRLAFSLRLLWALALLASLGILFAAYLGVLNEARVADAAAALSTLALAGRWLSIGFTVSATLVSLALACVLFWKKANEGIALYLSFFLLLWGIIWSGPLEAFAGYWLPQTPEIGGQLAGILMPLPLLILMLVFPNGQFAPRWTICLLPLAVAPLSLLTITTLGAKVSSTGCGLSVFTPWASRPIAIVGSTRLSSVSKPNWWCMAWGCGSRYFFLRLTWTTTCTISLLLRRYPGGHRSRT